MSYRRQARELALQVLFFLDIDNKTNPEENLEAFCVNYEKQLSENIKPFFILLVRGVLDNKSEIDTLIKKYSKNWKLSRMLAVDRNIIRIAAFELLKIEDIPPNVSINEAIEIAKDYGSDESGAFVNGIIESIKLEVRGEGE
jgi:transcription antitermination protein NusB